jgi:hypothetical protein
MKKALLFCMVLALGVALAAPAVADLKVTSKGYMQVQGLTLSNGIFEKNPSTGEDFGSSNSWYNMEMIMEPILHINDKVRIFARFRMMERNYSGTAAGELYVTDAAQKEYSIFGNEQNNFWMDRLFLTFPLFTGTLYVGRQSGGNWAYDFGDTDQNRDRIKWVGKIFEKYTMAVVVEKLAELDGGLQAPYFDNALNPDNGYTSSASDVNAYALGFVIPFTKDIVFKPLGYFINYQNGGLGSTDNNWQFLSLNGLMVNFGPLQFNTEFDYRWANTSNPPDLNWSQWAVWGDLAYNMGPFEVALTGFWIQGASNTGTSKDRTGTFTTGNMYQPLLLMFSEDMGLLYNSGGVPNGAVQGNSGYQMYGVRGGYKLTDTMKFSGIFGYLDADQMNRFDRPAAFGGASVKPDKNLGYELDGSFQWKLMNNLTYIVEGGYFWAGNYFKDYSNGHEANIYGFRNTIRVEW